MSILTTLLVNHPPLIYIHHFRRSILHRRVRVDLQLDFAHLGNRRRRGTRRRDGSKVAELEEVRSGLEDVFDLQDEGEREGSVSFGLRDSRKRDGTTVKGATNLEIPMDERR